MNFFRLLFHRSSWLIELSFFIDETINDYKLRDMEIPYPKDCSSVESIRLFFEDVFSNDQLRNTIEPLIWMKIAFNILFETNRQRSFIQYSTRFFSQKSKYESAWESKHVFSSNECDDNFFVVLFWERIFVFLDHVKSLWLVYFIRNKFIPRNGSVCFSISLRCWFLPHRKHRSFN